MQSRENSNLCNRLSFSNSLSGQFQRLTKYPLLVGQILKYSSYKSNPNILKFLSREEAEEEVTNLKNVKKEFENFLAEVNKKVKEDEDQKTLERIVTRDLDFGPLDRILKQKEEYERYFKDYKNMITPEHLKHVGQLKYVTSNGKEEHTAHCFLFKDCFLIARFVRGKYVVKIHEETVGKDNKNVYTYFPILKNSQLKVSESGSSSFTLASINPPQVYFMKAISKDDKKTWFDELNKWTSYKPELKPNVGGYSSGRSANIPSSDRIQERLNLGRGTKSSFNEADYSSSKFSDNQSDTTETLTLRGDQTPENNLDESTVFQGLDQKSENHNSSETDSDIIPPNSRLTPLNYDDIPLDKLKEKTLHQHIDIMDRLGYDLESITLSMENIDEVQQVAKIRNLLKRLGGSMRDRLNEREEGKED